MNKKLCVAKFLSEKLCVAKFLSDMSGCGHLRTIWPAQALNENGSHVHFETMTQFLNPQMLNSEIDAFCFHRAATEPQLDRWKQYRKYMPNAKLVYEIDDSIFDINEHDNRRAYEFYQPLLDNVWYMMQDADALIVNSTYMRYKLIKRGIPAKKIHIILNNFPENWRIKKKMPPKLNKNEKPKILFIGSASYSAELEWMQPLIERTTDKYTWVLTGFMRNLNHSFLSPIKGAFYPEFMEPNVMMHQLADRVDPYIGVCPKLDTTFNRCRGTTKMLECGILKIPAIGSKHRRWEEINGVIKLKNDHDLWEKTIDELVTNRTYYRNVVSAQNKQINGRWLKTAYKEWEQVFTEICCESSHRSK